MTNVKKQRMFIEIKPEVKVALGNKRIYPRESWNDILVRLLGLSGKAKEAEVSGASASSNSEVRA